MKKKLFLSNLTTDPAEKADVEGGSADLDLSKTRGRYSVNWYNPRSGGNLQNGTVKTINGEKKVNIGLPPDSNTEDWLVIIRKR